MTKKKTGKFKVIFIQHKGKWFAFQSY